MLENLDAIDWAALEDAYGPATEVPGMLRALASPEDATRAEGLEDLENQICHERSISQASAPAVPFLIELLGEGSGVDRAGILNLLANLATARSFLEANVLHEPGPIAKKWREEPDFREKLDRERGWAEATRQAIAAGLPVYLGILAGSDERLRHPSANLLAAMGHDRERVAAALREAFGISADDGVRGGLLLCLGETGSEWDVAFLRSVLACGSGDFAAMLRAPVSQPAWPVRWGAAAALVRILGERVPDEAIRVLAEVIRGQVPSGVDWGGMLEFERPSIRAAALTISLMGLDSAIPILTRELRHIPPGDDLMDYAELLIQLAFPDRGEFDEPMPPRPSASLTPARRAVLRALADHDHLWGPDRFTSVGPMLHRLGVPDSRAGLRRLLAS